MNIIHMSSQIMGFVMIHPNYWQQSTMYVAKKHKTYNIGMFI